MTRAETFVNRARWALAAIIVLVTASLVIEARRTTGFAREGIHYFTMGVWSIAAVVIPALLGIDLVAHLVHAGIKASRKEFRLAGQIAIRTIAADVLLLLLTLAAGLAVLYLAM